MSERRSGAAGWLRGLLGGSTAEPPPAPGRATLVAGGRAVWQLATRAADAIHAVDVPFGAGSLPDAPDGNLFDDPVVVVRETDARAAAAAAVGASLAGRRGVAFVPAGSLPGLVPLLRSAARRRAPVTVVAALEPLDRQGHDPFHAACAAGVPVLVAHDPQHAIDLFPLAVRIAEEALTPVVVGLDGPSIAWAPASVRTPENGWLRDWLGAPSDRIDAPTGSQRSLHGDRRRRIPAWFAPDRPALTGATLRGKAADAAAPADRTIVDAERDERIEALAREMERATGRYALSLAPPDRRPTTAIVAIGEDVAIARAAIAAGSGDARRDRPAVVAVPMLEPFPADAVHAACGGAATIVVLDRTAHGAPLADRVRAGLEAVDVASANGIRSLTWTRPDGAVLTAALARGGDDRAVHLGAAAPDRAETRFPKRRIALERLRREHPDLDGRLLAADGRADLRPPGAKTVLLAVREPAWPQEAARRAAEALAAEVGAAVVGRTLRGGHGHWSVLLTAAAEPFPDPGSDIPPDVVVALDPEPAVVPDAPAGTPVLCRLRADGSPDLPPDWIRAARERGWPVHGGADLGERIGASVRHALDGTFEGLTAVETVDLPAEVAIDGALPAVVRRFERSGDDWASLPRFWSEQVEPALAGEGGPAIVDPFPALRAVPPYTATLDDRSGDRERTPRIDPAACTGCGRCWTSCPEAAILPVAIGSQALLDAAADAIGERLPDANHPAVGKLRRAHKQVAARLDARVAKESLRVAGAGDARAAYHDVLEKLGLDDADRVVADRLVDEVCGWLDGLPFSTPEAAFHAPHRASKGTGESLLIAIDPATCNGCGICAKECADAAIDRPEGSGDVAAMRRVVRAWERLPDTPGDSVRRLASRDDVGPMAAVLLSRHASCTLLGGGDSPPGSGTRMSTRLVTAVAEATRQPAVAAHVRDLAKLADDLRGAVRDAMAKVLDVGDIDVLDRALDGVARRPGNAGEVVARLTEAGEAPEVDTVRARRLLNASRVVDDLRARWAEGDGGQGRARFALVVAGRRAAAWAAGFPHNPFGVPVTVDEGEDGADVAVGIARALAATRVAEARAVRTARLLLENPDDLPARERALARLTFEDLDADERNLTPRIVVLLDGDSLRGPARAGVPRLLASGLPVTCLALDDGDPLAPGPDPTLTALAHRDAYVVAASPSHPDLLFRGVTAAFQFDGPSFVHVLAPEPGLHGFPTDETVARARAAVRARVWPLLRYDPDADGVFGLRLDLDGNPSPDALLVAPAAGDDDAPEPASWAAPERRYAASFAAASGDGPSMTSWIHASPDVRGATAPTVPGPNGMRLDVGETLRRAVVRRLGHWRTLQELAGVETPFTDRVRDRITSETASAHRAALDDLRKDYEARLEEQRRSLDAAQVGRLRERLLQLAGYDPSRVAPTGDDDGGTESGS